MVVVVVVEEDKEWAGVSPHNPFSFPILLTFKSLIILQQMRFSNTFFFQRKYVLTFHVNHLLSR